MIQIICDEDDQMDLDGESSSDKRLDLTYDTVEQSWVGDGVSGSYPIYTESDGKGDGGDDGMFKSENDGKIKFSIYTDAEVSPSRQEELANKYAPVLYFHEDEEHYPREIQEFLDDSDLKRKSLDFDDPTIVSKPVSKSDLAEYTHHNYYLDWDGHSSVSGYVIYSRVFTATDNKIIIQYWFFYLYNDHILDHEGDWEMIQVVLDSQQNPQEVGYSYHYDGYKANWDSSDVTKISSTHPVVWVGKGGHPSYMQQGDGDSRLDWTGNDFKLKHEMTDISGDHIDYNIELLNHQCWLQFRGGWGETDGVAPSPPGPIFRSADEHNMWMDSLYWQRWIDWR